MPEHPYQKFYDVIRRIPKGKVATYGQIAHIAGQPRNARQVGYALAMLKGDKIPWHRVINAKGEVSERGTPPFAARQRALLKKEGILFNAKGRISFHRFGW